MSATSDHAPENDDALRAQRGDQAALEALVLTHRDAVARLLWRFARTRSDLDDLVQETFLRMVRGLPGWRPEQPFGHWLLRIATNTGRDYFRRQTVRRRWMSDRPQGGEGERREPEAVDPSTLSPERAAADDVKRLLSRLPPDERALLTLQYLEGWALADIARHFGWTVTATKLRAWRARGRLRATLPENDLQ